MKDPSSPKRKPKKTWYISHYSGSHYGGFHGIVMHLSSTCPFQPNSSQLASSRWFLEDLPKKTELHASVDDARKHQKDDSTCVFHMLGTWPLQGTSKRPVKSDTRKILEHWLSGWLFGWYLLVTATQGLFIGPWLVWPPWTLGLSIFEAQLDKGPHNASTVFPAHLQKAK